MVRSLALLVVWGCGRIGFDVMSANDASGGDATPCTWSAWSAARQITELQSAKNDWDPSLSPDGKTLVYSEADTASGTLLISTLQGTTWGPPATIPALDTATFDFGPAWSADFAHLYFCSTRSGLAHLWVSSYSGGTFGAPIQVPGLGVVAESAATLSADELEMFYTEEYGPTYSMAAIRRATRASTADPWTDLGRVPELNVSSEFGWPSLSNDGLELYFEDSIGKSIDIATRPAVGATFSTPVVVDLGTGPNNDPEISRDGTTMIFASSRAGSMLYDLYVATRTCN
jgi:Tol biopolymer transport system component